MTTDGTMYGPSLRHGIFMAPFHAMNENVALLYQRDFELVEHLDRLGFHEAWIGEHHSAGMETIGSPELFIAAAAERTQRIRFGTGVVSLPYHNPLMAADRIIQLDNQTRGRVMFGVGPGLLASDAFMLGIEPDVQRDRMAQGLDVILRLFRGEIVTEQTDWYTLREAALHLAPYTYPHPEVCVASAVTPSGGRLAGKYDLGMLCVAAGEADGFDALGANWKIANEVAAEHGRVMDPSRVRLVLGVHLAATREQAREDVHFGLKEQIDYLNNNHPRLQVPEGADTADWYIERRTAVIGTPDDVIERIERLQQKHGQFGAVLLLGHDWADREQTLKSFELYARYVMPHFDQTNTARQNSYQWVTRNQAELSGKRQAAAENMFRRHEAEWAERGKTSAERPADGLEATFN
jgi:limonene 1,2-monooxygenase